MKRSQCDVILDTLKTGRGQHEWSTLQLMDVSGSLAVHSRIAELRERGHVVEHRRVPRLRAGQRRMVSVYPDRPESRGVRYSDAHAQVRREVSNGSAADAASSLRPPSPPAERLCPNCLTDLDPDGYCDGCSYLATVKRPA